MFSLLCSFPEVLVKLICNLLNNNKKNQFSASGWNFFFSAAERKNWFLTQTNIFSLLTWEQCYSVKLSGGVCLHTADILTSHRVLNDQPTKRLISIQRTAAEAQTFTLCFSTVCFYTVWFFTVRFYTPLFCTLFPHSPPLHSLILHSLISCCSTWLSTQLTLSPAAALELQPHLFSHLAGTLSS